MNKTLKTRLSAYGLMKACRSLMFRDQGKYVNTGGKITRVSHGCLSKKN